MLSKKLHKVRPSREQQIGLSKVCSFKLCFPKRLIDSSSVIVLNEVDRLSKEAQHALRRTMEKYVAVCRLILCCNSTCKVIEPIRSRCLPIRVPAPTAVEVSEILIHVSKREGFNLPSELSHKIAAQSQRNLRKAILMLEATKVQQ